MCIKTSLKFSTEICFYQHCLTNGYLTNNWLTILRERETLSVKTLHPFSDPCTHMYCFLKLTPVTTPMSRARSKRDTPHQSLCQNLEQQLSSNSPQLQLRHSHWFSPHLMFDCNHCHCWTWHITENRIFLAYCFNDITLLLISNLLILYILLNQEDGCHLQGHLKHVSCCLSFLIQYQEVNSSLQWQTPSHAS